MQISVQSKYERKMSYTVQEVENILSVGRQTVYNLIKDGCFKAVLVDNKFRIVKASFDAWLDAEN
jgi:excisionase family DNA binding protein